MLNVGSGVWSVNGVGAQALKPSSPERLPLLELASRLANEPPPFASPSENLRYERSKCPSSNLERKLNHE